MQDMEQIYKKYFETVNKYLFCLTHNSDISEELTQETFYRAVKKINTFKGNCKMSVWLCQIAKNLWYDELKKNKKVQNIGEEIFLIQSDDEIEDKLIAKDKKIDLYKKIQKLDKQTREVIYLRITGELSFKEIGDILNKTENWARVTFVRKLIILISLSNKVDEYTNSTNYYKKSVSYNRYDDSIITIESYVKDEKIIDKFKLLSEFMIVNNNNYFNGEKVNSYYEIKFQEETEEYKSRKTAQLNQEREVLAFIPDYIDMSNPAMFFGLPFFTSIQSDKCDEKDCYRIAVTWFNDNYDNIFYIEKETGLLIRMLGHTTGTDNVKYDNITSLEYKFNTVTDEDFIEPDISEYEIEE